MNWHINRSLNGRVAVPPATADIPDGGGTPSLPDAGRELTSDQSKRAWEFLSNPQWKNFRFADDVRRILSRGRWIEQESFASIFAAKKRRDAK